MNKKRWAIVGAVLALGVAFLVIDAVTNYRIRHQEPWKLVADCEYDKATRMKFGASVSTENGRYQREDKFALLAKEKDVEQGMSRKKVRKVLGDPSFVEGTTTEDGKFDSCEWHYVISGRREPTGYFTDGEALVVTFDELGEVKSVTERRH